MDNTVIKVENLSKQYRLGEIGTGSMAHDLNRWWHSIRGKENPYLKIGETNDRTTTAGSDYVWSLKDINFEIKQGEAVGIIGRNGAGKSTLLKVLSRVTAPTTGSVKVKGRIASLLEVGTGFHPDLSGRDNIFLNGAILGMRKEEIKRKFDDMVDFAGVERYIDTPVKRYSSGMYVRLAFAVAAYLDSEILIVDEVLAVGDAEFQKKCLGKMNDVSRGEGRTVLFVSHNMDSVKSLCGSCLILNNGNVTFNGEVNEGLAIYKSAQKNNIKDSFTKKVKNGDIYFNDIRFKTANENLIYFGDSIEITIEIYSNITIQNLECSFQIFDDNDVPINYNWVTTSDELLQIVGRSGLFTITVLIPSLRLYKGNYYFGFNLSDPRGKVVYQNVSEIYAFEVNMGSIINEWGWQSNACKYIEQTVVNVKI